MERSNHSSSSQGEPRRGRRAAKRWQKVQHQRPSFRVQGPKSTLERSASQFVHLYVAMAMHRMMNEDTFGRTELYSVQLQAGWSLFLSFYRPLTYLTRDVRVRVSRVRAAGRASETWRELSSVTGVRWRPREPRGNESEGRLEPIASEGLNVPLEGRHGMPMAAIPGSGVHIIIV